MSIKPKLVRRKVMSHSYHNGGRYGKDVHFMKLACGHEARMYGKVSWWKAPKTTICNECTKIMTAPIKP